MCKYVTLNNYFDFSMKFEKNVCLLLIDFLSIVNFSMKNIFKNVTIKVYWLQVSQLSKQYQKINQQKQIKKGDHSCYEKNHQR